MSSFTVKHLDKTEPSITRHPDIHKFYLSSCQTKITNRTPTTEGWLNVLKLIKLDISDYDKSRILLGVLRNYGEIVVKIGDSDDIQKEYDIGRRLQHIKGYIKYICFFQCNDNFRNFPSPNSFTLCKGEGQQMKVILMPYFPLGSIAGFSWLNYSIQLFHSCLKHATLSMITAFFTLGIIHGDFHIGNVLLKKTNLKSISYHISALNFTSNIDTHGFRTWIMDFENSTMANLSSPYDTMITLNRFYSDLSRFFGFIQYKIQIINPRTIAPITRHIDLLLMNGTMINHNSLQYLLTLIDGIQFLPTPDSSYIH